MKDVINRTWDVDILRDIVLHDCKRRFRFQMAQVGGRAGDQVVDRQNFPAAIEEVIAKMRPEKSGATGDYRAQGRFLTEQIFRRSLICFIDSS
jgi:hypothetical protein